MAQEYIFSKGTCKKKEIYSLIIDKLKEKGWKDISSKPETDYVVLHSKGVTGDRDLILNLRDRADSNPSEAYSVVTTDYSTMSYRLQSWYMPGGSGESGTFAKPARVWRPWHIYGTGQAFSKETTLDYYVYVDAGKIILALEYPQSNSIADPVVFYLGEPDTRFLTESQSRGVLFAASNTNQGVCITDCPDDLGIKDDVYFLPTYALLATVDPNIAKKYMVSPIYYGSDEEGFRGKLDGVKTVKYIGSAPTNLLQGDTLVTEHAKYHCVLPYKLFNVPFPGGAVLLRIE
ncbi:hypothetical protein [Selenomonas sp.]|uniref:hypothetical protein n=1 Tax=Selenomonas sp. TaxID=2053611 RepID=UPI003FA2C3F6